MNSRIATILCAAVSATLMNGCAACDQHPVACTAAVAILVGAAAGAAASHHEDHYGHHGEAIGYPPPPCTPQPDGSCR